MSTDLTESKGVTNPLVLMQAMIDKGADPGALKQMMDLALTWRANEAAEEFSRAVSLFQAECPAINKSRTAHIPGKFDFAFASFDDVMRQAGPVLAKHGLAVSFSTKPVEIGIEITCRVRKGIHFEDHTLTLPIPAGVVTDTQRYGMALSYAKRYCMCAALNIVVTDEDNDATTCLEYISEEEKAQIIKLIKDKGVDLGRFLTWANQAFGGVDEIGKIPKSGLAKALDLLKRKKANGNGKPHPEYGPEPMDQGVPA